MPARHGGIGIELLGDVLTRSTLTDEDVESERQVILEELAMDDDSPDDVALRTLDPPAVPRPRPRPRHGGRARNRAGDHRRGHPALPRRALHRPARRSSPSPATSTTTTSSLTSRPRSSICPAATDGSRAMRPGSDGDSVAIDDDSEQVHLAIGGRAVRRGGPRPRGARRRQPRLRRRPVEPPVRRDPRASRARLQRVLGDLLVRRHRGVVGVRRLDARARRRGRAADPRRDRATVAAASRAEELESPSAT